MSEYEVWDELYKSDGYNQRQARQDSDKDVYRLSKEKLKNYADREIPDSYDNMLVSTKPANLVDRVAGTLANGELQVVATTLDGKTDDNCARIEELWRAILPCIDLFLSLKGEPALLEIISGLIALRGDIGGPVYPYMDKGETEGFIPYVLPWDTRYMASKGGGVNGLTVAGYRITKTQRQLEEDYPDEIIKATGNNISFTDIWDTKQNICYTTDQKLRAPLIHGLGYTPVSHRFCGATVWTRDDDSFKYKGESVLATVRDLLKAYNSLVAILFTLTMRAYTNGMMFRSEDGKDAVIDHNMREDNIIEPMGLQEGLFPMPLNDIQQATFMLKSILDQDWLFSTLPLMEYGDMSDQETVAQITTKANKTASFLRPRRRAIELYYDDIAYMFLQQLHVRNLPMVIKLRGRLFKLPKANLDDNFIIKHTLNVISPQQNIANAALAQALQSILSVKTLLTDIIQSDDPQGEIDRKKIEDIKRAIPQLEALEVAVNLAESEEEIDKAQSIMITEQLGISPDETQNAEGSQLERAQKYQDTGSQTLMPLMGRGQ